MRSSKPSRAAAQIQERGTLQAPSPMKATRFPSIAAELLLDGLQIREDLAGMLVIGQRIDRRQAASTARKFLHVALREGADDRAVHHAAHARARCP